ncbi:MAG TPA: HD domain-containing phosphohydrolase [Chloroflexota bacterium]
MDKEPVNPSPDNVRMADLLGALSLAADLAVGLPAEHGVRACYIGLQIGTELGLSAEEMADLYYAELLMDAGCTAFTSSLAAYILGEEISARRELFFHTDVDNPLAVMSWLARYMAVGQPLHVRASRTVDFAFRGKERMREGFRNTCDAAQRLAERVGMSTCVQNALLSVFEQWDGGGMPAGLRGQAIPLIARIVYVTSFLEVFHRLGGRDAALQLARDRRGKSFDPDVVDAFESESSRPGFWETLDQESAWDTVLALEPESPRRFIPGARIPELASSFADFADFKAPHMLGHSRRVAELAGRLGVRLQLPAGNVATIQTAGLLHDFGLVAVPSFTLAKPKEALSQAERETFCLHPHYGQRILSKMPVFEPVAELVVSHHEHMDGSGFPRGLIGSRIPVGARVIAIADHFDELTHASPGHDALGPAAALRSMRKDVGGSLWAEAFEALCEDQHGAPPASRRSRRSDWPCGLTDREVEVLRLLVRGPTRRQMADALVISESTVRAHLEHIYAKANVSSRAAATLFAVEHDLLG